MGSIARIDINGQGVRASVRSRLAIGVRVLPKVVAVVVRFGAVMAAAGRLAVSQGVLRAAVLLRQVNQLVVLWVGQVAAGATGRSAIQLIVSIHIAGLAGVAVRRPLWLGLVDEAAVAGPRSGPGIGD
jgi:hypothetical protein